MLAIIMHRYVVNTGLMDKIVARGSLWNLLFLILFD